jgi:branched-chain amino acid transport system substrate-binding protein
MRGMAATAALVRWRSRADEARKDHVGHDPNSGTIQGSDCMTKTLWSGAAIAALLATTSVANAQLKVGVAGPLTGPNAAFGAQLKNGAEQAAADINAKGGINGQKIELVFGDDRSDPKEGVSVANKMIGDGVRIIIGHFNSGVTIPASEVYAENGAIMISPSATNPKITERGLWNVFRTCGRDDQQGEVAAKYLSSAAKGKKVAIVHDKTTYGKGLADETQKAFNKAGGKEVLYEGINIGEKDFSALVAKIKASNADIVYWGGLHTEGGLIVRQMRDAGVKAVLMSGDGITDNEFASIGGPGVEGTLMTFPPDPRKRPEAAAIVKTFTEKRKFDPQAYTLYTYSALEVVAAAAGAIKSTDAKKIAAEVRGGKTYKTVIGDLKFDKKGDITRPDYVMYTWKKGADGKISYVQN